ncbi:MAG: hypothetical protein JW715_03960 [Sedimentisphaerales bacterium]|nr:hypothetical protein [Sedimentisphaerales bacterium]
MSHSYGLVVPFRYVGKAEVKKFVTKLPEEVRDNYYPDRKLVLARYILLKLTDSYCHTRGGLAMPYGKAGIHC